LQRLLVTLECVLDVAPRIRSSSATTCIALAIWAALIVVAFAWGQVLVGRGVDLALQAPPFWSPLRWHASGRALPALTAGALVVAFGPRLARDCTWRALVFATGAAAAAWAVVISLIDNLDGIGALTDPLRVSRNDYLRTARTVGSLPEFLSHFVSRIDGYGQDTMGHPPGMVAIEWLLDRVGLASPGWTAVLVVGGGAAAAVAALVALRDVAGEPVARAAAPFLVVVPAAIWWQSADAFYAGVAGWAVTLVVLSSSRSGVRRDALALAGGLLFGVTAFLSYGLVLMAIIPLVVCWKRRRARSIVLAIAGAFPVFVMFAALGFSWFAGFAATRHAYWTGVASRRPSSYFFFADLALLAVAVGPAIAVALARLRDRATWLLVGSAVAIVAIADASGMSKAEVERIWLPFVPWLVIAAVALSRRDPREPLPAVPKWLTLQVAWTVLVASTLWSWW
jgi:hypothetical protein